jgi:hypothetical protein
LDLGILGRGSCSGLVELGDGRALVSGYTGVCICLSSPDDTLGSCFISHAEHKGCVLADGVLVEV